MIEEDEGKQHILQMQKTVALPRHLYSGPQRWCCCCTARRGHHEHEAEWDEGTSQNDQNDGNEKL